MVAGIEYVHRTTQLGEDTGIGLLFVGMLALGVVIISKSDSYTGSLTAILFGDFSFYWIADRQGRSFKRLSELYAANGQIGFLASERVDGKLILPEAVKGLSVKAASSSRG